MFQPYSPRGRTDGLLLLLLPRHLLLAPRSLLLDCGTYCGTSGYLLDVVDRELSWQVGGGKKSLCLRVCQECFFLGGVGNSSRVTLS